MKISPPRQLLLAGLLFLSYSNFAAAGSLVHLSGSPADPITGGNTFNFSDNELFFNPFFSNDGFINLRFGTTDGAHLWGLTAAGPIVGNTFTGPLLTNVRYEVNPGFLLSNEGSANLAFSGDSQTYSTVTGGFTLYDLVISDNVLQSLAIQFDFINTQATDQFVSGYVSMNSNVALPPTKSVPEPATAGLMLLGLFGVGLTRHRRQKAGSRS